MEAWGVAKRISQESATPYGQASQEQTMEVLKALERRCLQRPLVFGHFPMTAERSLEFGRFLATAERSNRIAQALQPWVK